MRELAIVWSTAAYEFLLPWAQWGLLLVVLFGGPLALFKRTRPYAAQGLFVTSYAVGLATWFLGATVSFATFGFLGLFIGLFLVGVGVVLIGMVGAVVVLGSWELALSLLVMSILTYALRFAAAWLAAKDEEDSIWHAHRLHQANEEGRRGGRQETSESDEDELSSPGNEPWQESQRITERESSVVRRPVGRWFLRSSDSYWTFVGRVAGYFPGAMRRVRNNNPFLAIAQITVIFLAGFVIVPPLYLVVGPIVQIVLTLMALLATCVAALFGWNRSSASREAEAHD